jgi:hypothetical protein
MPSDVQREGNKFRFAFMPHKSSLLLLHETFGGFDAEISEQAITSTANDSIRKFVVKYELAEDLRLSGVKVINKTKTRPKLLAADKKTVNHLKRDRAVFGLFLKPL